MLLQEELPGAATLERLELASPQLPIWLELHSFADPASFQIGGYARFAGAIDLALGRQAVELVTARHDALRLRIDDREPRQWIDPSPAVQTELLDLSGEADPEVAFLAHAEQAFRTPIPLNGEPLVRFTLVTAGERMSVLLVRCQHLVMDGLSVSLLIRRVLETYSALVDFGPGELAPRSSYLDFLAEDQAYRASPRYQQDIDYWRKRLANLPDPVFDERRPRAGGTAPPAGRPVRWRIEREHYERFLAACRDRGARPVQALLALLAVLVLRQTGSPDTGTTDLVIGLAVAGRSPAMMETLGMFSGALPVRLTLDPDAGWDAALARVGEALESDYPHQRVAIDAISRTLGLGRSGRRAPFEVALSYLPAELGAYLGDWAGAPLETALLTGPEPNPLMIYVREANRAAAGVVVEFAYNPAYVAEAEAERLSRRFARLFDAFAEGSTTPLGAVALLDAAERRTLIETWNATAAPYPATLTLGALFEAQVRRAPAATALIFENEQLSYAELNARSNRLARRLVAAGAGPEIQIGVALARSPAAIVALLAVVKAGAAYLPLDPTYPTERLVFMLGDSAAALVVTDAAASGALPPGTPLLRLDDPAEAAAITALGQSDLTDGERRRPLHPDNLAYTIYTSGSTGRPKPVAVTHRGIANLSVGNIAVVPLTDGDRVLQFASPSFDAAISELCLALLHGASLVLAPAEQLLPGPPLAELAARQGITHHMLPPSALAALPPGTLADCTMLMACGEASRPDLVGEWSRGRLFLNAYGPTETTIWATTSDPLSGAQLPPIGRPNRNVRVYVVDKGLEPVAIGIAGELLIGGPGLARGYPGRPGLTAERFIADPFGPPGGRLYRTGDLARWREDGQLEFLGRVDQQIKIRGFRIEPGEVEAALAAHEAVAAAAVVAREDRPGDKRLVAYLVRAPEPPEVAAAKQLARWQHRFDEKLEPDRPETADPHFDTTGWNSSFDGRPIPIAEMREWAAETVEQVLALAPQRVLEIGSGTGMLLFQIAPHCTHYCGLDLSTAALDHIRRRIAQVGGALNHVELRTQRPDDLGGIAPGSFDLVLLNSVVQSFPSLDYLLHVIEGALRALRPGGALLLADLRSLPLLRAFHAAVQLVRAEDTLPLNLLRQGVELDLACETELCLDPGLFAALRQRFKAIGEVRVRLQRGHGRNELARFRYSALLCLGSPAPPAPAPALDGRGLDLAGLETALGAAPDRLLVTGLLNARVASAHRAAMRLGDRALTTVGEMRQQLAALPPGLDPAEVYDLAAARGFCAEIAWSPTLADRFDVAFTRRGTAGLPTLPPIVLAKGAARRAWRSYANVPHLPMSDPPDAAELRAYLAGRLLPAMIPTAFVWLEALPLSPNGKLDRKALPAVEGSVARAAYVAPRSEVEALCCRLMQEVVSHDRSDLARVGIDDHFFDVGGHSILAVHFAGRLEQALGRRVPVRLVFEAPTVRELAARLKQEVAESDVPAVTLVDRSSPIPASLEQERMWVLNELLGDRPVYNEGIPLLLRGGVDTGALVRTVQDLLDRYEVLRTRIVRNAQGLWQEIDPPGAVRVVFEDWSGLGEGEAKLAARAGARATALLAARYDLAREPPCRALVIKLSDEAHLWCLATHHIAGDNWSLSHVLPGDFAAFYRAHIAGLPPRLPEIRLHYADYAAWQRSPAMAARREAQLGYWRSELTGAPAALDLPSDRARPVLRDYAGTRVVAARLTSEEWRAVERFAVRHGATPFMVFEAALACLLYRVTGSDDVVIGTPHTVKPHADLWPEFGYFGNTLALRTRLEGGEPFAAVFDRVRQTTLAAFQHEDVPFEAVVEALGLRSKSYTPLFQVLLVMHAYLDTRVFETEAFRIERLGDLPSIAKFDLTIDVNPGPSGVVVDIEYARDMFDEATVLRLGAMYRRLLLAALAEPERAVGLLPLMEEAERSLVVVGFNTTAREYPRDRTVVDLFEAQAVAQSGAVAIVDGDRTVGYGALDRAANRLARHLIGLGVGPEVVVGVCLERSAELIRSLLAIWKAGGAYLPLDPEYPEERLGFMLGDGGARVVITSAAHAGRLAGVGERIRLVVLDEAALRALSDRPIAVSEHRVPLTPARLAYVIYTSGSTGKPKGVTVDHDNLRSMTMAIGDAYALRARDRVLQLASVAFTQVIEEVVPILCAGGATVIAAADVRGSALQLSGVIARYGVTVAMMTPTYLRSLPGGTLAGVERLVVTGERLTSEAAALAGGPGREAFNEYGSSETTVSATIRRLGSPEDVSIGTPVANTQAYVVDPHFNPQPVGVAGELLIGGMQVARGYLGRPGLTAEKFIADPFSTEPGARLYRTGDLARWRADGSLEFVGRLDHQVKVRGMRVELGEIEAALRALPEIADSVVTARRNEDGDTRLVGYVVPGGLSPAEAGREDLVVALDGLVDIEGVRASLRRVLPEHMVPSGYVGLRRLPLTASGKLDRKALPDVEAALARAPYVAPRTAAERQVAGAFAELLGVERVGVHDGFFDLGGHSLLAVRLVSRLEAAMGKSLPMRAVFEHPTVEALARALGALGRRELAAITAVDRSGFLPLSYQQERLWFLQQLDAAAGAAYNVVGAFRFVGDLDIDALRASLVGLVERHETLRTRFAVTAGRPAQVIDGTAGLALGEEDAGALSETALKARVGALVRAPFDLERGPAFRAHLLRVGASEHVLVLGGHHTVLDGWSVGLLLREASVLYGAHQRGEVVRLPALGIQYADYAHWQRAQLLGAELERQADYWREALAAAPAAITLPFDRPRPAMMDYQGGSVPVAVPASVTAALKSLARSRGATLFMVLQAAFAVLLSRLGGDRDVVIGTAVAGRGRVELEPVVGFFANTLALRHRLDGAESFGALLDRTKEVVLSAFEHQAVPFEAVVEAVRPVRSLSHEPLAQTMLILQNQVDGLERALVLPDVEVRGFETEDETAQFELSLTLSERALGLSGSLSYRRALFNRESAEQIAARFGLVLAGIAENAERAVGALPLMAETERSLVVAGFNATAHDYPRDKTVVELIEARAGDHPEAVAVVDGERSLTYGELDRAANRLARHLMGMGVGPEVVVGVCLDRSAELILTLLGIWKAGGAYLPLDPDYPEDRLGFMLKDAGVPVLVTSTAHAARLAGVTSGAAETRLVVLDEEATAAAIAARSEGPIGDREHQMLLTPARLAYVIYTSGSTGKPKGVMVAHEGLGNYAAFAERAFAGSEAEVVLHRTTIGFDYSAEELWWPLAYGHQVVIAGEAIEGDPEGLRLVCERAGVTTLVLVPSLLRALLEGSALQRMPRLRQVLCGGEALSVELLRLHQEQLSGVRLVNHYGPTEATINATSRVCGEQEQGAAGWVSIGSPVSNTRIYVVDERFEPQPVGVAGELVIGGVQVARGYLGRPGLTAEKFVADPFSGEAGSRIYRTGDLARWRPDGTVEFLGRLDHQVKIRGMRVELGEIEAALQALPGIGQSVVVARRNEDGDTRLVGYVVPGGLSPAEAGREDLVVALDGLVDIEGVRASLRRVLPEHMVPSGYVGLRRLPLTASGKLDRKALPDVEAALARAPYVAPRTAAERQVAGAFAELLGVERVGVHDGFFDLGGHSLLAVRLVSQLEAVTGKAVAVRTVFEAPTVEGLAAALDALVSLDGTAWGGPIGLADRSSPLPLSYQQERLWFLDRLDAEAGRAFHIEGALRLEGALDAGALEEAFGAVVCRHEALRTRFGLAAGRPVQLVLPAEESGFGLVVEAAPRLGDGRLDEAGLKARVDALLARRFDLAAGPLFRASLLRVSAQEHVLVVGGHHSVLDGWSVGLLLQEMSLLYRSKVRGEVPFLPPLPVQYGDYAAWQRGLLSGERLATETGWWRETLRGIPEAIGLPFDRPRPPAMDYRGGSVEILVPEAVTSGLKALARGEGATTLFMVLETAFAALLHRVGGDEDLVIGTAVAGRPKVELEGLAGFFVNTVALRHRIDGAAPFRELLRATRRVVLDAFEHQAVPFEAVVEAVRPTRSLSHAALLQVMVVLQNTPDVAAALELPGIRAGAYEADSGTTPAELLLDLREKEGGLAVRLSYASQLFDRSTAMRLALMYGRILAAIVAAPGTRVADLPLMDAAERALVVQGFNATAQDDPRDRTMVDLFVEQARLGPEALAVIDGDRALSYRSLDEMSNRLARHLIALGVGPERVVGVCLERSTELVVTLLGIWKAGGAYLPLDPDYPAERLGFMLADAGAGLVVTAAALAGRLAGEGGPRLVVLDDAPLVRTLAALPGEDILDAERLAPLTGETLAYVIYTSGSTGRPKGVSGPHRSLVNLALGYVRHCGLQAGTRGIQMASAIWIALLDELLPLLACGGTVSIYRRSGGFDAEDFWRVVVAEGIDYVVTLPRIVGLAPVAEALAGRRIAVTGDRPRGEDLERAIRHCELWNAYGSTEIGSVAAISRRVREVGEVMQLRPFAGAGLYVLDGALGPCPIGVVGEVAVGGAGLARGYVGSPGLTAEKFIADPFSTEPGARLYRTGDLARWRADGSLEFVGRLDHQVKVRGMRVELGEIEAALRAQPAIADSVVTARRNEDGDTRLVAYVVPGGLSPAEAGGDDLVVALDGLVDIEGVRASLRRVLPEHMVPSGYVGLRRLPLTASGKLDRKALPEVEAALARAPYVAPRTAAERQVAGAFAALLGVERVGVHDGFFDLGGHSLLAVRLVSRLAEATGKSLPIRAVFEHPTVADLAQHLTGADRAIAMVLEERPAVIPVSYRQRDIWFSHQAKDDAFWNQPFANRISGLLDSARLLRAVTAVIERHEALRTAYPAPDGEPIQVILPASDFQPAFEDLTGLAPAAQSEAVQQRLSALGTRRFDLTREIPVRVLLMRLGENEHVLAGIVHHISFDGTSIGVFLRDLAVLYAAESMGGALKVPPLPLQFADAALWHRRQVESPDGPVARELRFWRSTLAGVPSRMPIPFDRPEVPRTTRRGRVQAFHLNAEDRHALLSTARRHGLTLFMALHAGLALLLARWCDSDDILIGTPTAGRPREEFDGLIGCFADATLLRTRFEGDPSLADYLAVVREGDIAVFANQVTPFLRVIAEVLPERASNPISVIQVMLMLMLNNVSAPGDSTSGVTVTPLPMSTGATLREFNIDCFTQPDGTILGSCRYDEDLFEPATVERLMAWFHAILVNIAADPAVPLSELLRMSGIP